MAGPSRGAGHESGQGTDASGNGPRPDGASLSAEELGGRLALLDGSEFARRHLGRRAANAGNLAALAAFDPDRLADPATKEGEK